MRALTPDGLSFARERHLATLSTMAPGGGIHVVPVGFTLHDDGLVRIITSRGSQKVRNILRDPRASVGQVDGARWLTFQGTAEVRDDPEEVALAVALYTERYRPPRANPERVAIVLTPSRVMGSAGVVEPRSRTAGTQ